MEAFKRAVTPAPGGSFHADEDLCRGALAPGTSGCILDGRGAALWESPQGWFASSGIAAPDQEVTEIFETRPFAGSWVRVISSARAVGGAGEQFGNDKALVRLVLMRPLSELEQSLAEFRLGAAAIGAALLTLTAALLWAAIRVGLLPVREMIRHLREIPGPTGKGRLDEDRVPEELRPLAREINDLSGRLWEKVEWEKRFTAEAAHELRTPITLVKSTLQTAIFADRTREDHKRSLHEALEDLQRLETTAESLLALARTEAVIAGSAVAFVTIELNELLRTLAERFGPTAEERGLEIHTDLCSCTILGDRDLLERLFSNLIENAVRYTKVPGRITIRCERGEAAPAAAVEDSGPTICESERALLFEKFFRGAAGRAAENSGAGLGLSIAAAIASLHGAQLAHEPRAPGGNRFILRWGKSGQQDQVLVKHRE